MANNKKSFLLHIDSLDILDDLTNGQAGVLFKAIKAYQKGEDYSLDSIVKIAFSPFKNQFIRDNEKYIETCKKRAAAGSKGGKQKVANATKCKQELANVADNKNKNKTKNNNEKIDISTLQQVESLQAVCSFILNDGSLFYLHQEQFFKWVDLYKAVNIEAELRKMIGWLDANPSKRKTRKGFMRFANNWLSKQQDKGGNSQIGNTDHLQASSNSNWHKEDLGL